MIDTTKPYCLIWFEWPWLSFKVPVVQESETSSLIFSPICRSIWMKIGELAWPFVLFNLISSIANMQERERDVDVLLRVCFRLACVRMLMIRFYSKLVIMIDVTKLYILIPICMAWILLTVTRLQELVLWFCCKVAWSNPNIHSGWLCEGDDWNPPPPHPPPVSPQ